MGSQPRRSKRKASSSKPELKTPKVDVVKMGRPTVYLPEYCDLLIEHNKQGLSFESFGAVVGVGRTTLYAWVDSQPDFKDAKERGRAHLINFYEQVVRNVAMGIVPKPPEGALVTRGNPAAAIYLMKVHGKEAGFQDDGTNKGMGQDEGRGGLDTAVNFNYIDQQPKKVGGNT